MYLLLKLILLVFVNCVESEVVDLNFARCKQFFYKGSPPNGFENPNNTAICQRYNNNYHFATLYNPTARIPVYSAYTLDTLTCPPSQPNGRSTWFIEPQLSGSSYPNEMSTEGASVSIHKMKQAINIDYLNTSYDRGHLNPNFYQCNEKRTATFTLTNAVPQVPGFNKQEWKLAEAMSKEIMQLFCDFEGAKRFFITGASPGSKVIPNAADDTEGDQVRDYNRVNVPSVMWTAACCDSSNAKKPKDLSNGFSFGYYGDNIPDSLINSGYVEDLENVLDTKYGITKLKIFVGACSHSLKNSANSSHQMKEREVRIHQAIKFILGKSKSGGSSYRWKFTDEKLILLDKRSDIYRTYSSMEKMGLSPLLSHPDFKTSALELSGTTPSSKFQNTPILNRELRDIQNLITTTRGTNDIADEYIVLSSYEQTLSATLSRCRQGHPCDYYGEKYKWCYIDWSNNWDYCCNKACGFEQGTKYSWCFTGEGTYWAYCSRRSSMVSVPGRQCRADHECGTHGEKYHWCYTDTNNNWEYCCQPGHVCAEHGSTYKWCYVGRNTNANWQYCYY